MVVNKKIKRVDPRVKYRGITQHARQLGVSRLHLWMVLQGRRPSKRLLARYHVLTGNQ